MTVAVAGVHPLAPGPKGIEVLGLLGPLRRDALGTMARLRGRYGNVYRLAASVGVDTTVLCRPEAAAHVLQHHHKNYRKGAVIGQFKLLDGEGLVTSEGELWTRQRKLAQPAFHRQRLVRMAETMVECTEALAERWRGYARRGDVFDTEPEMMQLTLQVASRTLFSRDVSDAAGTISPAVDVARDYISARFYTPFVPAWIPTPSAVRFWKARRLLDSVVYGIIEERRRSAENHDDLLAMFMQARDEETGEGMSDTQLRDEVMTMLMAGHESTAVTMTWAWHFLAHRPDLQERLHAEIDRALNGRAPTHEDLAALPYSRMVVEEALRHRPVVWALSRQAVDEDEILGYRIPKNAYIGLGTYFIQHDPEIWPDPERFDPERFAPEKAADRHPFAFLPFGGGPRGCIGRHFAMLEAQFALVSVVQRFRIEPGREGEPELEAQLSLRARGGVPVRLRERG